MYKNNGDKIMIKKFSVKNFKNFKEVVEVDFLKTRDYEFKQELIKDGLINKMLIYGKNNSGKSNLGAAMMDITRHLTENQHNNILYAYYMCGDSVEDSVDFKYEFIFNNSLVLYSYKKNSRAQLIYEELIVDNKLWFIYNYQIGQFENNIEEANTVDLNKKPTIEMSALKFIYNNTRYWSDDNPFYLMMSFVNNMLWYRSLKGNEFMGVMNNGEDLNDFIINNHYIKKFNDFLTECGQNYNLCEMEGDFGKKVVGVQFKNEKARFDVVASTGTLTLWVFFYWMNRLQENKISFMFLDEFDAFYHYALSTKILNYVNEKTNFQSVLTSHNTFLIDNEIMRPDCYAILKNGKLKTFAESTKKTIRQGHNLEKMMLGGEFED